MQDMFLTYYQNFKSFGSVVFEISLSSAQKMSFRVKRVLKIQDTI